MDVQENVAEQAQEKHGYENADWIHVHDWAVSKFTNHETGEDFWSIKLPKETYLEVDGEKRDVGHYRFTTNVEPALTYGEAGSPKAMRGIHYPDGWTVDLRLVQNVAKEGHPPIFEEVDRIEKVTPKQLAEALKERDQEWKLSNRKAQEEQVPDKGEQAQDRPQVAKRSHEPAL